MTDLTYVNEGFYTSFIPQTSHGEDVWKKMNGEKILTAHLKSVLTQIRNAGYTVTKSKKATKKEIENMYLELDSLTLRK